jgi:hypothetical protein
MFEDFSRVRIEEHYDFSHSRKYALFKQIVIPQLSAQAVRRFFDSEKVEAYFDPASAMGLVLYDTNTLESWCYYPFGPVDHKATSCGT